MISCHDLVKSYRGRRVVDGVTFDVAAGSITGLLGPNGSGRTTVLKGILGLTSMDRGEIVVDPAAYAAGRRRPLGASLDVTGFRGELSGGTVVHAAALRHGARVDVVELLRAVGLTDPHQRISTYSLGMRQRLRVALALVIPPAALVLDEPLNGLDPAGIRWLRTLLRQHADRGGAVLFSSHLLNEAEKIVDSVVVLDAGRTVAQGPLRTVVGQRAGLEDVFFSLTEGTADQLDHPHPSPLATLREPS